MKAPNEHGRYALVKLDMDKSKIVEEVFSHPDVDIDQIINHPNFSYPIGVSYTLDHQQIHYFDDEFQAIQKQIDRSLPSATNVIIDKALNAERYIIRSHTDQDPGVYYIYDIEARRLDALAVEYDNINPEEMSHTKTVSIKAKDGSMLQAYLSTPPNKTTKPRTAVVIPHDLPYTSRATADWNYLVQFLTSHGYAVLQPNYRGSYGYGLPYKEVANLEWSGIMTSDIKDAAQWLVERKIADEGGICILGEGYGGFAALTASHDARELFQCTISINGITDLEVTKKNKYSKYGYRGLSKNIGLKGADDKKISPLYYADDLETPLLLISGVENTQSPYKQTGRLKSKLRSLKKNVEYIEILHGTLETNNGDARRKLLDEIATFLSKHIGPNSQYAGKKASSQSR